MALLALLIIIILSLHVNTKNDVLLTKIKTYNFPALELYQNIYLLLIHMQYNFQDAVTNKDEDVLNDVVLLKDSLEIVLNKGFNNPELDKNQLKHFKRELDEYYESLFLISSNIIYYSFTEQITDEIQLMITKYERIKEKIYISINNEKQNMETALIKAKYNHDLALTYTTYVTITLILLLSFFSYLIIQSIRNPLSEIARAAHQVYKGNLNISIKVKSKDVLGVLASSFNIMIKEIRDTMEQINKRNWLKTVESGANNILQVESGLPEIAKNILLYITKVINAQIGALYIKKDKNKLLMISSYTYKRNIIFTKNNVKLSEYPFSDTVIKKEIVFSNKFSNIDYNIYYENTTASLDNIVIIPLIYNSIVEGVLELGSFYTYSDIQLQFLKNVSRNIAVAFHMLCIRIKTEEETRYLKQKIIDLKLKNKNLKKIK